MTSYFEMRQAEIATNPALRTNIGIGRREPAKRAQPLTGTKRGTIYFIGDMERVKIGFATDLSARLHQIQTGNSSDLTIFHCFKSYIEAEKLLHARFKDDHVRGEWFELSDEIEEFWDDMMDYHHESRPMSPSHEFMGEYFYELDEVAFILATINQSWVSRVAS